MLMDHGYLFLFGAGLASIASLVYLRKKLNTETVTVQDGLLTLDSLIRLLKSIRQRISEELVEVKREFLSERRKLGSQPNQELIDRYIQIQLAKIELTCSDTLRLNRVTPDVFDKSLAKFASNSEVVHLTDCFEPLSNSTFNASTAPAGMDQATFIEILEKHESMLAHELKLRRVLSHAGIVQLQASISYAIFKQFGFEETQVAAASAKFEANLDVRKLKIRIKQLQKRLMARKQKLSKTV